jgi:hypothetical protein
VRAADCIHCDEAPAVSEDGYCGHCHWAVKILVVEGLYDLLDYLESDPHVAYVQWCREHRVAP